MFWNLIIMYLKSTWCSIKTALAYRSIQKHNYNNEYYKWHCQFIKTTIFSRNNQTKAVRQPRRELLINLYFFFSRRLLFNDWEPYNYDLTKCGWQLKCLRVCEYNAYNDFTSTLSLCNYNTPCISLQTYSCICQNWFWTLRLFTLGVLHAFWFVMLDW